MKGREVTGKDMIRKYLDRISIIARIAVEEEEMSKEEALKLIEEYGNETITRTMNMGLGDFAILAMMELVKANIEMGGEENETSS